MIAVFLPVKSLRMISGRQANSGLWIALALLLVVSLLPLLSLSRLQEGAAWRVQMFEVVDQTESIRTRLRAIETGEPMANGEGGAWEGDTARLLRKDVAHLAASVRRNPPQNARVELLPPLIEKFIASSDSQRDPGKGGDSQVDRTTLLEVRGILAAIHAEERSFLKTREISAKAAARQSALLTLGGSVLAVIIISVAALALNRQLAGHRRWAKDREVTSRNLEAVNRELEAFSYSVSHDLRAPLRHIDGFVSLLGKRTAGQLDEKSQRYLETIGASARQMGHLIDDLLAFSRMGRHEMRRETVDPSKLLDTVRQELAGEAVGREVVWEIGETPTVLADRAMLRLAFLNLASNALKYTRPRLPAEIRFTASADPNGEVVFCLADNGVGFDMQYAGKLFGVFQRLHRAEEFEGTGIGLANVQRIVQRHGGRIWAESAPDRGATFFFTLPNPPNP